MTDKNTDTNRRTRYVLISALALVAFFAAYGFAVARTGGSSAGAGTAFADSGAAGGTSQAADGSAACACCGGGSGEPIEGATAVEGDVQRIDVDTSSGGYAPNTIKAKAGVPIQVTFGQSDGCLAQVVFPDFQIVEDLTGGPKTIELPALDAGEYQFYCGMQMVFGKLVVE